MPRRDKTGPEGSGVMTGRRLGPCNQSNKNLDRRGYGRCFNKGNGRANDFNYTKENLGKEKEALKSRLEQIDNELK